MSGRLHIAAITRFSIVHEQRRRTFARTIDLTIEQARAVILDPARMDQRFALFSAFTRGEADMRLPASAVRTSR